MNVEAAGDRVRELLERIAKAADVEAGVELHQAEGGVVAEYVGDDIAVLIGRHGETIDAIQHLAYRIATHGEDDRVSVLVDAGGYRDGRAETLRGMADQAAATALRDGHEVPLESMSALERKVIHEHLKDRHDLETFSRGQEPGRYLVVAPLVED